MEEQNRAGAGRRGGGPPQGGGRRRRRRRRRGRGPMDAPQAPGVAPVAEARRSLLIDPFELFCALYLGITPQNTYRPTNLAQVARRFNTTPEAIRALLDRYGLDPESLARARFDVGLAQLDMQVLPDGIDRTEQAKVIWQDFLTDSPNTRRSIDEARREAEEAARSSVGDPDGYDDEDDDGDDEEEDGDEEAEAFAEPPHTPEPASAGPAGGAGERRPRSRKRPEEDPGGEGGR